MEVALPLEALAQAAPATPEDGPVTDIASKDTTQKKVECEAPMEVSPLVAALHGTSDARGAMMRTAAGLAASLPFAMGAAARGGAHWGELIQAVLSVPVSLALVAIVGVSASTIGVSFFAGSDAGTSVVSPGAAIDMASRGVLRTGLVLLGLAPVTLLSVLSASRLEGLLFASIAWAAAGVIGTSAIARRLSSVGRAEDGTYSIGAVFVSTAFTLFAWVFGARLWYPIVSIFAQTGGAE